MIDGSAFFLFIAVVMFFIDDDGGKMRAREMESGSCSDEDGEFSFLPLLPDMAALCEGNF